MRYLCLYYSATGNTERAVEIARREIEAASSTFDAIKLKRGTRIDDVSTYDALVVAFPVLAFAPPTFVNAALRALPNGKKETGERIKAYILAVDGGGGGSAAARAARTMEKRGYHVVSSLCASYPSNWIEVAQQSADGSRLQETRVGDESARGFAREVLAGTAKKPLANRRLDFGQAVIGAMFGLIGRRMLGKLFYADEDCNSCGLCERACPSKTILLGGGPRAKPFWKFDCENCNACMNICPRNAINASIGRIVVLSSLILLSATLGVWTYCVPLKATIGWNLASLPGTLIDIVIITAIILTAHFFPVGLIDRFIIRFVQRIPLARNLFAWTFTRTLHRYKATPLAPR